jgi:hypothetical protein
MKNVKNFAKNTLTDPARGILEFQQKFLRLSTHWTMLLSSESTFQHLLGVGALILIKMMNREIQIAKKASPELSKNQKRRRRSSSEPLEMTPMTVQGHVRKKATSEPPACVFFILTRFWLRKIS